MRSLRLLILTAKTAAGNPFSGNCLANYLFRCGELAGEGDNLKAALQTLYPDYSHRGPLGLLRFSRVLTGWRRLAPPQPALPLPVMNLEAIAERLLEEGRLE